MELNETRDYIFTATDDESELKRLQVLERAFDPTSQRRLRSAGLRPGWRCLEVGAGAGSIARWLASEVGATGQVMAVDLDPRFLQHLSQPNLQVQAGDVCQMTFAPGSFDLIHTRYVLIHIEDLAATLDRFLGWLAPGGVLVLEEPTFGGARAVVGEPAAIAAVNRVNRAIAAMFSQRGLDPEVGARLPARLQALGGEIVAIDHEVPLAPGGSPVAQMLKLSSYALAAKYLATGEVTTEDLARYAEFHDDRTAWSICYGTVGTIAAFHQ